MWIFLYWNIVLISYDHEVKVYSSLFKLSWDWAQKNPNDRHTFYLQPRTFYINVSVSFSGDLN